MVLGLVVKYHNSNTGKTHRSHFADEQVKMSVACFWKTTRE